MSKYVLFGRTIEFDEAADRFCKLQFFAWDAAEKAVADFDAWYTQCGNITTVLNNYLSAVKQIVVLNVIKPLYNTLPIDYQIYNISEETYTKQCLDLSEAFDLYEAAVDAYNEIEEQLQIEKEYREYRKAMRSEVVGGGFGLGGAIKGMAAAGAINMATGAAHSVANAFGNASSESDAASRKSQLFRDARSPMKDAVEKCILETAYQHIDVINSNSGKKIFSRFDSDQGLALFESAKKVPEKEEELLVESFRHCPWLYRLYTYIFNSHPDERRNIIAISKDFYVDLSDTVDELLSKEYPEEARQSEEMAQASKARIKTMMDDLGVAESKVFDLLESDCLARLCPNVEKASENECNGFLSSINEYDALLKNKQPYLDKVQARIEAIWAKEDGDIFDNYIHQLNILDPEEVSKGIQFVESKSRTAASAKYISALKLYSVDNIKKVRLYRRCAPNTIAGYLLRNLGWLILGFGGGMILAMDEGSFWLQTFPIIGGGVLQYFLTKLKKLWNTATVNNLVVHSVFTMSDADFNQSVQNNQLNR